MSKWAGVIGYVLMKEDPESPHEFVESVLERKCYGEFTRGPSSRAKDSQYGTSTDVVLTNTVSIIADQFAYENAIYIKYVTYMGNKWRVSSVEVQRPRLILTLGEVYNG